MIKGQHKKQKANKINRIKLHKFKIKLNKSVYKFI